MQSTRRLLATVTTTASGGQPARYLTPGNPTGLTGLLTHPSPRSTLIYLYTSTLNKLSSFPSSSAYRASTETITKHRLSIVESVKPSGHEEWTQRTQRLIEENPRQLGPLGKDAPKDKISDFIEGNIWEKSNSRMWGREPNWESIEWDGQKAIAYPEGGGADIGEVQYSNPEHNAFRKVNWESAPSLEANQVSEIEKKIGSGLIEEVIEVARGELELANRMAEANPWEELEVKAPQGQWQYFAREQHMPGHDEPGNKS